MKLLIVALAFGIAGGAQAQEPSREGRTIVVEGRATLRRPPDYGRISFGLTGEGSSQIEALQALAAKRARVEGALVRLVNAKHVDIDPSPLEIEQRDCSESDPPAGCRGRAGGVLFVASLDASARITPAEQTGDAASLAAEMGAAKASVMGGGLLNESELEGQAARAALGDARLQARAIADAEGVRLGPILKVISSNAGSLVALNNAEIKLQGTTRVEDLIDNLPQAFAAHVGFARTVQPVEESARFTVVYAIEP